jgi:hypothetical protein
MIFFITAVCFSLQKKDIFQPALFFSVFAEATTLLGTFFFYPKVIGGDIWDIPVISYVLEVLLISLICL